jgi:hypothetical protein
MGSVTMVSTKNGGGYKTLASVDQNPVCRYKMLLPSVTRALRDGLLRGLESLIDLFMRPVRTVYSVRFLLILQTATGIFITVLYILYRVYIYRFCSSFKNIGHSPHTSIWPYSVRPFWLGSELARWIWLPLKLSVARCWLGGLFFWNPPPNGGSLNVSFVTFEVCVLTISTCVSWYSLRAFQQISAKKHGLKLAGLFRIQTVWPCTVSVSIHTSLAFLCH